MYIFLSLSLSIFTHVQQMTTIIFLTCSYIQFVALNLTEILKFTIYNIKTPKTPNYIFEHIYFQKNNISKN